MHAGVASGAEITNRVTLLDIFKCMGRRGSHRLAHIRGWRSGMLCRCPGTCCRVCCRVCCCACCRQCRSGWRRLKTSECLAILCGSNGRSQHCGRRWLAVRHTLAVGRVVLPCRCARTLLGESAIMKMVMVDVDMVPAPIERAEPEVGSYRDTCAPHKARPKAIDVGVARPGRPGFGRILRPPPRPIHRSRIVIRFVHD